MGATTTNGSAEQALRARVDAQVPQDSRLPPPRPAPRDGAHPHPDAGHLHRAPLPISVASNVGGPAAAATDVAVVLSLDGFSRHFTSEDNDSFSRILEKAESLGSPTPSAPGSAEEDSVAGVTPARSVGSIDDAAAVAQKGQGVDKSSPTTAESSNRRKEQEQQQPATLWTKLLPQCSHHSMSTQKQTTRSNDNMATSSTRFVLHTSALSMRCNRSPPLSHPTRATRQAHDSLALGFQLLQIQLYQV